MANPDPGGGPPDLSSLQDNFSQQQVCCIRRFRLLLLHFGESLGGFVYVDYIANINYTNWWTDFNLVLFPPRNRPR